MIIKKAFLFTLLLTIFTTTYTGEEKLGASWHFDVNILRDKKITKQKLLEDGFVQVAFESFSENKNERPITLQGLFLRKKNTKCTIIFSHGFCPGGKEKFAPLVKLAPDYCNLLFIELRGHGESEGPHFISRVKHYGKNEYKDIFGAIKFAQKETDNKPIIIFGWCSGAFHSATTLLKMKNKAKKANVKGLIFDSGFGSLMEISQVPYFHIRNSFTPGLFVKWYDGDKKRASQSYICKFTYHFLLKPLMWGIDLYTKPSIRKREPKTNLYDKISNLYFPTLFIHAADDQYAPWEHVKKLVEATPEKELWLIQEGLSTHATNHLKVKMEYKKRMYKFIEKLITQKRLTKN